MIPIARAMLKNSSILLLDDVTSSLDSKSEYMVQKSLENLIKGRITILIAQRLSTIINTDKIYLDNSNIVEVVTHKELLKQMNIMRNYINYNLKKYINDNKRIFLVFIKSFIFTKME